MLSVPVFRNAPPPFVLAVLLEEVELMMTVALLVE